MKRLWFVSFIALGVLSGPAWAVSPNPKDLEIPSGELLRAKSLIVRLGSEVFLERESAQQQLSKMGRLAGPILRGAATADPDPEVRARASRLLPKAEEAELKARTDAFLADVENKFDHDMPGWHKFKRSAHVDFELFGQVVATDRAAAHSARELFVQMIRSRPTVTLLTACERGGGDLAKFVGERRMQMWLDMNPGMFVGGFRRGVAGTARQPTLAEFTALLFAESLLEGKSAPRVGPFFIATTQFFHTPSINPALQGNGTHAAIFRRILTEWFRNLADPIELQQVSHYAIQMNLKEALPAMKRALTAPGMQVYLRAQAVGAVAKLGGKDELATLRGLLTDETTVQQNRFPGMDLQIRDVALAMCLVVTGQDPKDYGYALQQPLNDQIKYMYWTFAFQNVEKRKEALKKWAEWEAAQAKKK